MRHANAVRYDYITNKDLGLTKRGREEVKAIIEKLRALRIQKIMSSPLRRAVETSSLISESLGIGFSIDERFREYSYGKAEGLLFEDIKEKYNIKVSKGQFFAEEALRIHNYFDYESYEEVVKRVVEALEEFSEKENVLIITHGEVIRSLFAYFKRDISYLLERGKFKVMNLDCFGFPKLEKI